MKSYIALFVVFLISFLIAQAPASLTQPYLNQASPIQVQSLSGTIWSGSAQLDGVESVEWRMQPWALLTGVLEIELQAKINADNFASTTATLHPSSAVSLTELYAQITTEELQKWLPNTPIMAQGVLQISDAQAQWDSPNDTLPKHAQGLVVARKLDVFGTQLGDYQAKALLDEDSFNVLVTSLPQATVKTELNVVGTLGKTAQIQGDLIPQTQATRDLFKQFSIPEKLNFTQPISNLTLNK